MSLHYTKSGGLDMRYSSSYAAVASSGGGGGYYGGGGSRSSRSSGSDLHYTKSGALDMRYNSSHTALASGYTSSSSSQANSKSSSRPPASELHYTKSGALDMRYKSSQAVVQQLRKTAAAPPPAPTSSDLHYTKSGALDMRYKSSREVVEKMEKLGLESASKTRSSSTKAAKPQRRLVGVPRDMPVTKAGVPDLRTNKGKEWVQTQARNWHPAEAMPAWVPSLKDGSPDMTKAVARHFIGGSPALEHQDKRVNYYENKCLHDRLFERLMQQQRELPVELVAEPQPIRATVELRTALANIDDDAADDSFMPKTKVAQLNLQENFTDNSELLGQGAFGVVYRSEWKGKQVAIKKLHAAKLTKKERKMFIRETLILGMLGDHPNIVQLYGYSLDPVSLVMEYVSKGSLSYLLHYCEDSKIEAKMTDGRVKLNILLGIAYGMAQLHECNVTHGDLKPQNVLITDDFQAKIADFGLATFRAKAASTTSSHMLSSATSNSDDDDVDFEGIAGGTAAYMAPELMSSSCMANEKTDVYSFGVLMNEVLHEEEPYTQNLRQFVGKGPFAAVLFAKDGNRPQIRESKVTPELKWIIERCWSPRPNDRPTFDKISKLLAICTVPHAC